MYTVMMEAQMNKFDYIRGVFGSDLKPRARLVLQCLIYHANKDGMCFPSIKTIAAECGYGLSTVKRALNDLCEAGYIEKTARFDERKNGGQTSNLYALTEVEPKKSEDNSEPINDETGESTVSVENVAYEYTFSEGLKKLIGQSGKAVNEEWTGGQFNFIPP